MLDRKKIKRWQTLKSEKVFENRWLTLVKDKVKLPSGEKIEYTFVERPSAVVIIPKIKNQIPLIRQYRYPINDYTLELPMGAVEKNETLKEAAKRELLEETGFIAGKLKKIGEFYPMPGIFKEKCHIFLALNLRKGKVHREKTEIFGIEFFNEKEIKKMIKEGKMQDGYTLMPILYYFLRRKNK